MRASPGEMIREARRRARLSQTDLARRVGVAQSVISAYEADRREPSLQMLVKLIEATGHGLSVELVSPPANCLGLPDTRLGRRLRRNRRTVLGIADRRGAHNVRVFRSVARGQDDMTSDIDLDDGVGLVSLAGLQRELAELLGVNVDVVPASSLKPTIRDEVMAEAIEL